MTKIAHTIKLELTLQMSELPKDSITDLVAGRVWMMDGVEVAEATLLPTPPDPDQHIPAENGFSEKIRAFNAMYQLPIRNHPTPMHTYQGKIGIAADAARVEDFHKTIADEVDEGLELAAKLTNGDFHDPLDFLTELADWLGDIQIYCASEMRKFGLDNDAILAIIMASNMSKLGEDGQPIYDRLGKVLKGPNYWKPEPMIRRFLAASLRQAETPPF